MITARLNPVLARELRERARSRRTFIILTVALAVLASILDLIYTATRPSSAVGVRLQRVGLGLRPQRPSDLRHDVAVDPAARSVSWCPA